MVNDYEIKLSVDTNWAFRKPSTKKQNAHTRKTAYTFSVFYNWSTKKTEPTVFQNRTEPEVFLKTEPKPNLKNPFRTSLLFGHTAWLDDSADAKKILTAFPPEDWKRRPGCPRITWMKTVLNDFESDNLTLTKAVNMAQSHPLWRLLAASGAMQYALKVVQARNMTMIRFKPVCSLEQVQSLSHCLHYPHTH